MQLRACPSPPSIRPILSRFFTRYRSFAIHPHSRYKSGWDWFVILLVIYSAVQVPVQLAFAPPWMFTSSFDAFDAFVSLVFAVDIVVNLHTGAVDKWCSLLTDKR